MDNLLKLHRVESQVRGLRSRLDTAQRYFDHQNKLAGELESLLREQTTRRRQTQATISSLEVESAAAEQQIEKFRNDLNASSTVKQYTAVQTEMNTVKERRARIDDDVLAHMERMEQIAAEVARIESLLAERRKLLTNAAGQLDERRTEIGSRLVELERERAVAATQVPEKELRVFEEIAGIYDGEVMSVVLEVDRRNHEYACGECNMLVPYEQVVSLLRDANRLVRCPACFRILYRDAEQAKSHSKSGA